MNQTRQRILKKSLELFNEKGVVNVSLRDIAKEITISVGNLQYHYKKREDILEGLYFDLVQKIDAEVVNSTQKLSIHEFLNVSVSVMTVLFEYRFFLIDFVSISRNNETIKTHYSQLSIKREAQFIAFIDTLIAINIFREPFLKDEYTNLYKAIEVISNFWFSNSLIQKESLSKEVIDEYALLIEQVIYPYLTEKGRNQLLIK